MCCVLEEPKTIKKKMDHAEKTGGSLIGLVRVKHGGIPFPLAVATIIPGTVSMLCVCVCDGVIELTREKTVKVPPPILGVG